MNTEWFIAKKVIRGDKKRGYSRPVVRIAILGIILGITVMILAAGIVTGFRTEIRDKVVGFGSHIRIESLSSSDRVGMDPIKVDQPFYPHLDTVKGVRHIQKYAYMPGIVETEENIQGIMLKGIGSDFDPSFFKNKMVKGEVLEHPSKEPGKGVLISDFIADRLELEVGEDIIIYVVKGKGDLNPRKFKVKGVYDTGLEKFDKKFILLDIRHIQEVNNWGLEAQIRVIDSCKNGGKGLWVEGLGFGGKAPYRFEWKGLGDKKGPGPHSVCIRSDSTIRLVLSDEKGTIPDTAKLHVNLDQDRIASVGKVKSCHCGNRIKTGTTTSGGSGKYYTGGFEVILEDFKALEEMDRIIYRHIGYDLQTTKITDENQDIFSWLSMLDINVLIIIVLMIGVAAINMTSALLVLILERTNMIGILKAMGSNNWSIRKIFLYHAAYLILIGLFWGNILGIGLGWIQQEFGILTLSEENYYLSKVPVILKAEHILLLDVGTLILCSLVLILPSYLITRISPVKAIQFD